LREREGVLASHRLVVYRIIGHYPVVSLVGCCSDSWVARGVLTPGPPD
jgi:hypothetical protein